MVDNSFPFNCFTDGKPSEAMYVLKYNLLMCVTSSSDVWCYDLILQTWWKQETTTEKPSPRYGQSQIALDDDHLLIMGK